MKTKTLSIIIPVYNEEQFVGSLLQKVYEVNLSDLGYTKQIIIINDGSKDKSEEIIQAALKQLRKKCTIVIVAHRLSTVKDADKIFVLNKGSLIEEGNHNELVMIDGVYKSLIKSQWRDLA